MDNKTKVLIVFFAVLVTISVTTIFQRYILSESINYYIDEEAFQASLLEE